MSRPARGAWIEIEANEKAKAAQRSRPARGAWIEIGRHVMKKLIHKRRAPHGARGLKLVEGLGEGEQDIVAPRTGRVD